jgi:frataxin-like iron-binding protein CyaY
MDTQDFEVTVRDTFEGIDHAIELLALDGVEPYPQDSGMRLMFADGTFITLTRNDGEQHIDVLLGESIVPFYYDDIEEQWYSRKDERPLLTVLSQHLATKLGGAVALPDLA